jgi:hypothetical protein
MANDTVYKNIIYVGDTADKDPYRFYEFVSESEGIRSWKLDIRLVAYVKEIKRQTLDYMVYLFRKMYRDVFDHNEYKEDFLDIPHACVDEMTQLINNIYTVIEFKKLAHTVARCVQTNCEYTPDISVDQFDRVRDSTVAKREFHSYTHEPGYIKDIMSQLFDSLDKEIDLMKKWNQTVIV